MISVQDCSRLFYLIRKFEAIYIHVNTYVVGMRTDAITYVCQRLEEKLRVDDAVAANCQATK